jgi:PAS domain S-box-containing protein
MKLLYFGNERLDAQNLATAVRAIARNGTVSWTTSAERAATWMAENKDVAALVVEGQVDAESWRSILACVRGLSPRPAVIVVTPEGAGQEPPPAAPGADDYVERNSAQFRDLPMVVIRAVARARGSQEPHHPAPTGTPPPSTSAPIETDNPRLADLERKLTDATAALQQAERRHASAMADAANQLAGQQLQYEAATAGTAARWQVVDEQLRAAAIEAESARQNYAAAAARVERLSRQEAELSSQLAAAAARTEELERRLAEETAALERRLADATDALDAARQQAAQDRRAAADELAERQGQLQALIDAERGKRIALETALAEAGRARGEAETRHASAMVEVGAQLRDLEAALRKSRHDHESSAADVTRLSARETELSAALEEVRTSHGNLERRLTATEAAFQDADERATRERLAATRKAATREAELETRIRQEQDVRVDIERALAAADAAREDAQQRHEAALAAAARELSEHQALFERDRSQLVNDRDRLAGRVGDVEAALAQEQEHHRSTAGELARLAEREADLASRVAGVEAQLADARAARASVERRLAETGEAAALREAELATQIQREREANVGLEQTIAEVKRSAAVEAARLAQREADLSAEIAGLGARLADSEAARQAVDSRLADTIANAAARAADFEDQIDRERTSRSDLERAFAEAEAAWGQAQHEQDAALAAAADALAQHRGRFERELAQTAGDRDRLSVRLRDVEGSLAAAERRLVETGRSLEEATRRADQGRADAAAREAELESRLTTETAARQALEQTVNALRAAAVEAEQRFQHDADGLRTAMREQQERFDAQLARQAADHQAQQSQFQAELAASTRRFDDARAEHRQTIDRLGLEHEIVVSGHRHEIEQLHGQLASTLRDLDNTRQRLNGAQTIADGLPRLQQTLDEVRAENGRLFQQAGLAMFRCTRDGAVTQANRAAMTLVGRRTIDELRGTQFAAGVFEDPNGLSWLIERCLTSRTRESIETTWRRKDGGRLFVRLSAYACAPDVVEIVAEDVTRVRVLQERLGQAHRMEAVGRLGSEVAVTCGNLLTDVHQQVQQLLLTAATGPAVRQQGEQLLADVTRAAGLMRQLYAYGGEQAHTPALADLSEVIHDLEPVLKRVAGDAVDVQLPGTSSRLNVDVGSERIERLLVNLASYGRARMPGGQLKIEVGTTVVDRRFAAKHPNVRLGPHALITVTKTKNTRAEGELPARRDQPAGTPPPDGSKPSMDFGTLQGLVGGCGGHLWMTLQPEGELVAKIHLPLLAFPRETAPRTLVARGGRALTRLFQH